MGMVDDYYEKEEDEERRVRELRGSPHDSLGGVLLLCLPFWAAGLLVFAWTSVTGELPWGAEENPASALSVAVHLLYLLGAIAAALLLILCSLLLGFVVLRRVTRRG